MKLPSQIECKTMLDQLEKLEAGQSIESKNVNGDDVFPESCSTWLLTQLKGPFNIHSPAFYPFPCSSKELFSWVERNNQISEEALRNLVYEEAKLNEIKTELKEYCQEIPAPKQIELETETPIDHEFLDYSEQNTSTANKPKCFIWQWGKFHAFIAPQEMDLTKVNEFQKELKNLRITPDAFILMPYTSDPLEKLDEYFGGEIWHTFPPTQPLLWEETKVYLEAVRCQYEFEKSLKGSKINHKEIDSI